jgi:hypothetical protein
MSDKTYLVRMKLPHSSLQHVIATKAEIRGDHLVFVDAKGQLAALFLMEIVQSWKETGCPVARSSPPLC